MKAIGKKAKEERLSFRNQYVRGCVVNKRLQERARETELTKQKKRGTDLR